MKLRSALCQNTALWLWTVVISADSVDSMRNILGFVFFCFPQIFLQMFFWFDFKESQLQAVNAQYCYQVLFCAALVTLSLRVVLYPEYTLVLT